MLNCSIVRDLLPQYEKNALHPDTRAEVEEHALTCPTCAALLKTQARKAQPSDNRLRSKQLLIWGSVLAIILIAVALVLSLLFLPEPIPKDSLTCGDLRAEIFQQEKNFRLNVSAKDTLSNELLIPGFYQSAMWSGDGTYLVVRYLQDNYICTFIYNTSNRTTRYLDSSLTKLIRYYDSAFSFLSGETTKTEGMHYAPWAWSAHDHELLIFAKGTDSNGFTRHGYFLYSLFDGTIDGIMGFDDAYLDIPATPIPIPPSVSAS